jgi:hypothetical protein
VVLKVPVLSRLLSSSCALIHRHRPDLIDWDSLPKDPSSAAGNMRLAFKIADEHLGIPVRSSVLLSGMNTKLIGFGLE